MLAISLPLAELFPRSPGPYVALRLIGCAVGILGHLSRTRLLVAVGVILIFLGALLFPLAANLTTDNRPTPIEETSGDFGE